MIPGIPLASSNAYTAVYAYHMQAPYIAASAAYEHGDYVPPPAPAINLMIGSTQQYRAYEHKKD